jgi:predicted dehydrogenase
MKTPAPLKLAVIGCGAITEQSYLPALSAIPDYEVVSLVDSNLLRTKPLAERYQVSDLSRSIEDIPPGVEAAVVALPNILHAPVSCELMKKGLPVFCEKPMATTEADAQAMIRCAHENAVLLDIGDRLRLRLKGKIVECFN